MRRSRTTTREEQLISEPRINDRIRVPEVRLVGPNGEQVGIVRVEDALRLAQEADLDLVEVAPDARPPVCKLMDYGKFKYESAMKARDARRNQSSTVLKEIRFRLKIDPHDYGTKKGHVERFLKAGDKVKIMIMFRGREQSRPEAGMRLLQRLADDIAELGFVESAPRLDGRNMIMVLAPTKKKSEARAETRRRPRDVPETDLVPELQPAPVSAEPAQAPTRPVQAPAPIPPVQAPEAPRPASAPVRPVTPRPAAAASGPGEAAPAEGPATPRPVQARPATTGSSPRPPQPLRPAPARPAPAARATETPRPAPAPRSAQPPTSSPGTRPGPTSSAPAPRPAPRPAPSPSATPRPVPAPRPPGEAAPRPATPRPPAGGAPKPAPRKPPSRPPAEAD